jgi:hypothetical protein
MDTSSSGASTVKLPTWVWYLIALAITVGVIIMGAVSKRTGVIGFGCCLTAAVIVAFISGATAEQGTLQDSVSVAMSRFQAWAWALIVILFIAGVILLFVL